MKYIDEYRDPSLAKGLLAGIKKRAQTIGKQITIMEVCGSHTYAIGRFGIRKLLPDNIRLISGPGCPVCVTSIHDVDIALFLAMKKGIVFATFGDMLRVPGTEGNSLQKIKASGADVRVVSSAIDCMTLADNNRDKEIVFMGIGFETTSPTIASVVNTSARKEIGNFSVFAVHKVMPPAIKTLVEDPALNVDGFLCPGHVSTIIGADAYFPIIKADKAAVITGFEPVDILEGIFLILDQIVSECVKVDIQYSRGVKPEGNTRAMKLLDEVFRQGDAEWRGLGTIPESGLTLKEKYERFDALKRFNIPDINSYEIAGCCCGDILRGSKSPHECPLFKRACNPLNPIGPCMVSNEGTCATYYKYH